MNREELLRFNELSQKALKGIATKSELLEFKKLLLCWNSSIDFNFNNDHNVPASEPLH